MKVNVLSPILDYEDKPVKDREGKEITCRNIIFVALSFINRDEVLTVEQKEKAHEILLKLYSSNEPDFTDTQRVFIKERAGKILSPLEYGRIKELFDENKTELTEQVPTEDNN